MPLEERKGFIQDIISQRNLALTDGLLVLRKSKKFIFSCDFYNKDGSRAEMCGNAACCMSFYARSMSYPLGDFQLGTEIVSAQSREEFP